MGILIHQDADPLSEFPTQPDDSAPARAVSASAQVLQQELERYCSGRTEGRSFLIAGHRGSGKTTLVMSAIERVQHLQKTEKPGWLRPLPVLLHGPSLFDSEEPGWLAANSEEQAGATLAQVVLGLHRNAIREITRCYRARAVETAATLAEPAASDVLERAAQFEIEVLEDPHATRLREFWERAGALRGGVLHGQSPKPDQGMRELVALNGLCNAHQRISGALNSKDTSIREEKTEVLPSSLAKLRSLELAKPVAATFAGTAVTAAGAVGHSLLPSALLGLLAAGVASMLFESGGQTTEKRSRQVDTVFIPDLTPKTLDRLIPVLIRRLHDAGLAPVLIVDELDKVKNLAQRMDRMIPHLKKLVAEHVFTCFLTDRGYLEHVRIEGTDKAYDSAYSYFSHTLLMSYRPQELDKYLRDKLAPTDPFSDADKLGMELLPWVLKHRSRLHTLALQRELSALRGDDGQIAISSRDLRSTAYQIDVTLQFAIELQLRDRHLNSWLQQQPHKVELLHDALYYLSRQWLKGSKQLCIDKDGEKEFFASLEKRMNRDDVRPGELTLTTSAAADGGAFTEDDRNLLLGVLKKMIGFLGVDQTLEGARRAASLPGDPLPSSDHAIWEVMLLGPESVLEPTDKPNIYEWRYWASGMARGEEGEQLDVARNTAKKLVLTESRLRGVLGTPVKDTDTELSAFSLLSERCRILPITPAWSRVVEAIATVESSSASSPTGGASDEDFRAIAGFARNLEDADVQLHWLLAQAASLAAATRGVDPSKPETDAAHTRRALVALSEGLRFASLDSKGVDAALDKFRKRSRELGLEAFAGPLSPPPVRLIGVTAIGIDQTVKIGREHGVRQLAATAKVRQNLVQTAWTCLHNRLRDATPAAGSAPADASELLCALWETGPAAVIGLDPQKATLEQWTQATLAALGPAPADAEKRVPLWLAHFGLESLGASSLQAPIQAQLMKLLGAPAAVPALGLEELEALQRDRPWKGSSDQQRVGLLVLPLGVSPYAAWKARPTAGLLAVTRADSTMAAIRMLTALPAASVYLASEQPSKNPWPAQMDELARLAAPPSSTSVPEEPGWLWVGAREVRTPHLPVILEPQGPDAVLRAMPVRNTAS